MGLPALKEETRYTYKDYLGWGYDERWELIDGVAYNMSPAPSRTHQEISGELFTIIHNYLKGKECKVYHAPFDVRLPEANESDEDTRTVVQPDIVVICDKTKLDERGCKGAPDLVIEILSPHTLRKDMREKLMLYERHRVKEYWIVHPVDKILMAYRLRGDNQYSRPDVYSVEDKIESATIEGLSVELQGVFKEEQV